MPTKTRRHLRCPCCGKLSLVQNFGPKHAAEVRVQGGGLGRGRGWGWSAGEPLTSADRALLAAALRAALERLGRSILGDSRIPAESPGRQAVPKKP